MKTRIRSALVSALLIFITVVLSVGIYADAPASSGKELTIVRAFDDTASADEAYAIGASFTYEIVFAGIDEGSNEALVTLDSDDYDAEKHEYSASISIPDGATGYNVTETVDIDDYHTHTASAPSGDDVTFDVTDQTIIEVTYTYSNDKGTYERTEMSLDITDENQALIDMVQYFDGSDWIEDNSHANASSGNATFSYDQNNGKYYREKYDTNITKNVYNSDNNHKKMTLSAGAPINKTTAEYNYAQKTWGIWIYDTNNKNNANGGVDSLLEGYSYAPNTSSAKITVDSIGGRDIDTDRYSQYFVYTNPIDKYRYIYEATPYGVNIVDSTATFKGSVERKTAELSPRFNDTLSGVEFAVYNNKTGERVIYNDAPVTLPATAEGYTLRVLSVPDGNKMPDRYDYDIVFDTVGDSFKIKDTDGVDVDIPESAGGSAPLHITKAFDSAANADLQRNLGFNYKFDIFINDSDDLDTATKLSTEGADWTPSNGTAPGFFTLTASLPTGTNKYEVVERTDENGIAATDGVYKSSPAESTLSGEIEPPSLRYKYTEYTLEGESTSGIMKASELNLLVNADGRYYFEDGKWKAATAYDGGWYGYYSEFRFETGTESYTYAGIPGDFPYVRFVCDKDSTKSITWYHTGNFVISFSDNDAHIKKNYTDAYNAALNELYATYPKHDTITAENTVSVYTPRTVRVFDTANPVTDNDVYLTFTNSLELLPATVTVKLKSSVDIDGACITDAEKDGFSAKLYKADSDSEADCTVESTLADGALTFVFNVKNLEPNTKYIVRLESRPDVYVNGDIYSEFTTDDEKREFTAPDMLVKPVSLTVKLTDNKSNPLSGAKFEISEWHITGSITNVNTDKFPAEYITGADGSATAYKLKAGQLDFNPLDLDIIVYRVRQNAVSDEDIYDIAEKEWLVYINNDGKIAKAGYDSSENGFSAVIGTIRNIIEVINDGAVEQPVIEFVNKIISGSVTLTLRDSENKFEIDGYAFGYLPRGAVIQLCDADGNVLTDFTDMFVVDGKNGDFTDNGDGTYSLTDVKLPKDVDVTLYYKITKYPDGYYSLSYGDDGDFIFSAALNRGYRDHAHNVDLDPIHIKFDKYGYEDIWDNGEGEAIDGAQFVLLSADMNLDAESITELIRDIFDDLSFDGVSEAIQSFDFSQFDLQQLLELLNSLTTIINISGDYDSLIPTILFAESDENGLVDFTNFILPTSYNFTGDGVLADVLEALGIDADELLKQIAEKLNGLVLDDIEIPDWLDGVTDLLLGQGADINIDQFIAPGEYLLYEIKTGTGAQSGDDEYGRGFLIWRVTVNEDGSTFIAPGKYSEDIAVWLEPYEELFKLEEGQITQALTPVQIDGKRYDGGEHFRMKNFIEKGLLILDAIDDETKLIIRNFLFDNVDFDTLGRGEFNDITSIDELRDKLNEYIDGLGDYLITRIYEAEVEYRLYKQNEAGVYPDAPEMYLLHKDGYWFTSTDGESYDETVKFNMMFRRGKYLVVTETAPDGYVVIPNGNTVMPDTDAVEFSIPTEYLDIRQLIDINDDYYRYIPTSVMGFIPGNLVRIPYKACAVAVVMLSPLPILEYDVGDDMNRDRLIADATAEDLDVGAKLLVLYRNYKWKSFDLAGENIDLTDDEIAALTETQGVKLLQPDGDRYIPLTWTDEISGKVFDDEIFFNTLFNVWVYGQTEITATQKQPVYYLDDFYSFGLYINYIDGNVKGSRILPEIAFYYDEECTQEISFIDDYGRMEDPLPVGHYYYKLSVAQDDGILPPDLDELWRGGEIVVGFDVKPRPIALQVDSIRNGDELHAPYSVDLIIDGDRVGEYLDTLLFSCTVRRMAVVNKLLVPAALPIPSRAADFDGEFYGAVYSQNGRLVDFFPIKRAEGDKKPSFTRLQSYIEANPDETFVLMTAFIPNEGSNYTQFGLEDIYKKNNDFSAESEIERLFASGYTAALYKLGRRSYTITLISESGVYDAETDTLTVPFSTGRFDLTYISSRSAEKDFGGEAEYSLVSGDCVTVLPNGKVTITGSGEATVGVTFKGATVYDDVYDELKIIVKNDGAFSDPLSPMLYTRFHNVTASAIGSGVITNDGVTSVLDGESITFICTPADGFICSDVKIDGLSIGEKSSFKLENITGDHTVEVVFTPIVSTGEEGDRFTDVTDGDSFGGAVEYLADRGIFMGVTETEFGPYMNLTRGMFVTILGRCQSVDTSVYSGASFSDVTINSYYAPYIEWASKNGLVLGYGDGSFGADNTLTREQMFTILSRYSQIFGGESAAYADLSYTDADEISPWALDAIGFCAANGYIDSTGSLRPRDDALRCEVAEALYRYLSE